MMDDCMHCLIVDGCHSTTCPVLEYQYFVVNNGVILAGNEFEDDALDAASDFDLTSRAVVDLVEALRLRLHPFEISTWGVR
jgi:hypothetical protein